MASCSSRAAVAALVWANVSASSYDDVWSTVFTIGTADHHLALDAARVGQRRADGGLLLRRRPRDQARARRGRAARPAARRAAGDRRARRDDRARARLRRVQPRRRGRRRLGHPDGHRHRVRGRRAQPARQPRAVAAEAVPARARDRRRHRRDPRDRRLLLRRARRAALGRRGRRSSAPWCCCARSASAASGRTWSLGVGAVAVGARVRRARHDRRRRRSACSRRRSRSASPTWSTPTSSPTSRRSRPRDETVVLARESVSVVEWLEHLLHPWTSYVIVPLFALANAGVALTATSLDRAVSSSVTARRHRRPRRRQARRHRRFTWLAVRLGVARLPDGTTCAQIVGVAALGGIGFTVSLFVSGLAFGDGARRRRRQDRRPRGVGCRRRRSGAVLAGDERRRRVGRKEGPTEAGPFQNGPIV